MNATQALTSLNEREVRERLTDIERERRLLQAILREIRRTSSDVTPEAKS